MNFFFHFLHLKKSYSHKNVKNGSAVTDQTVKRFHLHSWYLYQSEQNCVLYKTIDIFFFEIHFSFRVIQFFFQKNVFSSKKLKFKTA